MIRNHLKIAWRNIWKKKFHTAINMLGLISSMAFVLLIAAYVWKMYQINSDIRHKDRQYLLQSEYKKEGIGLPLTTVGALPKALREEYPDLVANYYRIDGLTCIVSNGDGVYEEAASLGDPSLLDMFGFQLYEGDPHTALRSPFSVVITEAAAIKYFGKTDVFGENLRIRNFAGEQHDFKITGVLKPSMQNSVMELNEAMKASIFLPIANERYFGRDMDNWNNLYIAGYLELQEDVTPKQLQAPMQKLLAQHADQQIATNLTPQLKPITTYLLDSDKGAVRQLIQVLSWIAVFLLIMAIVNFINFTISQSFTRLKEIAVRKMMGSRPYQLILQLLIEYSLLVWFSGFVALGLYPVLSPLFESLMQTSLPALSELPLVFFGYFIGTLLVLGLLTGLYPAFKLSQNQLLDSLKNQLANVQQKHLVRRVLLFVQFTVTTTVLIAAVVISRQVNIFLNSDLGYDKDYLITAQVPRDWSEAGLQHMETVRAELLRLPEVEQISLSYDVPGSIAYNVQPIQRAGSDEAVDAQLIMSDAHFSDTYRVPLLAGRFFGETEGDGSHVVINNKTAIALGYRKPEDAIDQAIVLFNGQFKGSIAGVTTDFQANSMHHATSPMVWFPVKNTLQYRFLSIRLRPGSIGGTLDKLENKWKELLPDAPFAYQFADDAVRNMYSLELQLQRASQVATFISVLIIALGLTGLTALAIHLRLKEVGIRKVLGASLRQLILLFSKEFYITFFFAMIVACPLAYVLLDHWLSDYAKRTRLDPAVFMLPLLGLLGLLFLITGAILLRSVRANPVDSLRDE